MIYVRTVKYHVTIKGVVNLYFPVKKLPSVQCNNAVGDRAHGATLLSERNLCAHRCGRGFTRTRLRHWERLPFVLRPQRPAPCTSFIFRSKATLPLAPEDPAPSTPPSVPLLPPAPLALTAGYFPPGAQHRPENLTLTREPDSRSVRAGPLRRLLAVVLSRLPQSPSFFKWSRRPKFYDQQTHSRVSRVPGSAPARCRSRQLCEGGTVPAHILRVRKLRHREAK